jgi:hypothetical protein
MKAKIKLLASSPANDFTGLNDMKAMSQTTTFHKVLFYSKVHGRTAGLILNDSELKGKSTSDLSRLFPYSEAPKMKILFVSQGFNSWNEAFEFQPVLGQEKTKARGGLNEKT